MTESKFYSSLSLLIICLTALSLYMHSFPSQRPYSMLSYTAIFGFSILNVVFFHIAKFYSDTSADKKFLNLVYVNFISKFILAIAIPLYYFLKYNRPQGNFVLPFIVIYICFTIFETRVLYKMAVIRK